MQQRAEERNELGTTAVAGHTILINLLGGIALLVWATRMVRTGVLRAFGERFRRWIGQATSGALRACLTGMAVATAVQSSAATAMIVVSFTQRGLVALAPALAVMLGADIGSTLVVQALAFNPGALVPFALIGGVATFMFGRDALTQQVGRILIGLALMIMALGMIVGASQALRGNPALGLVLGQIAQDPWLALVFGALFAWLLHSSVATVLLVASLAASGLLPVQGAIAIVLGANIGSALIPIGLSWQGEASARRVLIGNLAFRAVGAIVVLLALHWLAPFVAAIEADPARQIANAHTLFNVAVAAVGLPLIWPVARLLERWLPDPAPEGERRLAHLDESLIARPQLALGQASREVMRLADMVEIMLRETILAFDAQDEARRKQVKSLDEGVDRLQEEIKLYLTRLTREKLSEEEGRRAFDLILFTTNLEHIGDIIDRNLLELAAKKQRLQLGFSPEGWAEIQAFHARVVEQMRRAVTVFVTRDPAMARELVEEKDLLRLAEREAVQTHLERLRAGKVASIETSSLHLDILRDLKRINAHITSVALPILEANGELRGSRLRPALAEAS